MLSCKAAQREKTHCRFRLRPNEVRGSRPVLFGLRRTIYGCVRSASHRIRQVISFLSLSSFFHFNHKGNEFQNNIYRLYKSNSACTQISIFTCKWNIIGEYWGWFSPYSQLYTFVSFSPSCTYVWSCHAPSLFLPKLYFLLFFYLFIFFSFFV